MTDAQEFASRIEAVALAQSIGDDLFFVFLPGKDRIIGNILDLTASNLAFDIRRSIASLISSVSISVITRSMTFSSSRTFPGQR